MYAFYMGWIFREPIRIDSFGASESNEILESNMNDRTLKAN